MPTKKVNRDGRYRDTQRQKVYDAEDVLAVAPRSAAARRLLDGGSKVPSTGAVSIEACQAYVDWLTDQAWFQRRWGRRKLLVRHKVHGNATGGYGRVTLPPWARTEHVILHEVAHGLLPKPHAWHGPEYVGIFLTLVRHTLGEDAGRRFSDKLRQHKASRSMVAVPAADSHAPVTATQRVERERAAKQRPVSRQEAVTAAEVLRRAIAQGAHGASGTKTRTAALAVARTLEKLHAEPVAVAARPVTRRRARTPEPLLSYDEARRLVEQSRARSQA